MIVETAAGNIGYAHFLARRIAENPDTRTADLITPEAIRQFITQSLPKGAVFLACSVLALFSRIGYDGALAGELDLVAETFGFSPNELRIAARTLTEAGLLSDQGRYRAVTPHPMAVYLAAAAWKEYGDRIVRDLLPSLDLSMSTRLFRRAADIGEFEPTHSALVRLLNDDGPFASLEVIERENSSALLTELAVMAPREVTRKITSMLSAADEDELRSRTSIRRGLVWTLSKLVWHSYTFDRAADALLRLALAENETWSNNATGTWVELFGLMLPATAAKSPQRLQYLGRTVNSKDARARLLAVRACAQALSIQESILVSGELQGGVLVEGRGSPETWEEVETYRTTTLDFLARLAADVDQDVAAAAVDKLVSAIRPLLEHEQLGGHLARILVDLNGPALIRARLEIDELSNMFGLVEGHSGPTDNADDAEMAPRRDGLEAMRRALPDITPDEELSLLSRMHAWALDPGNLQERVLGIANLLDDPVAAIFGVLEIGEQVPAAFVLGQALSQFPIDRASVEERLVRWAGDGDSSALVGYLWGRVELGAESAYDDFLDDGAGRALAPGVRLALTGRGPTTDASIQRAKALSTNRPVVEAVRSLIVLRQDSDLSELAPWLAALIPRVSSQEDYNAMLDFISLSLHRREVVDARLIDLWLPILRLRSAYPALGRQERAWRKLAVRAAGAHPVDTVRLVIDLAEEDVLRFYDPNESAILTSAVQSGGLEVWAIVMDGVQTGKWKLKMSLRGWFGGLIDADDVRAWVGSRLDRARAVASVSTVGEEPEMHGVAIFLFSAFPEDQHIESSFYGEFVSGSWTGHESDRINQQIQLVQKWKQAHAVVSGVIHWCDVVLESLGKRLGTVLQREAEEDWR